MSSTEDLPFFVQALRGDEIDGERFATHEAAAAFIRARAATNWEILRFERWNPSSERWEGLLAREQVAAPPPDLAEQIRRIREEYRVRESELDEASATETGEELVDDVAGAVGEAF